MSRKRILYAVQGTGNGHVARAREIIPILKRYADLDILLSGDQSQVDMGHPIRFRDRGLTFLYNRKGAIDYFGTLWKNNPFRLLYSILRLPVHTYDLVINDFEFTSAWACKWRGVACYGLGHQMAFRSSKVPRPKQREWLGEFILKWYAPTKRGVGFHFDRFDTSVESPVIRSEVRKLKPLMGDHYTVYLPAFGNAELMAFFRRFPDTHFEVFSKRDAAEDVPDNVVLRKIENEAYLESLAHCKGLLCSAGFEGPTEALYLGKKLCVIPIRGQYEQACNAAGLEVIGASVLKYLDAEGLTDWLQEGTPIHVEYPDRTEEIIRSRILAPSAML